MQVSNPLTHCEDQCNGADLENNSSQCVALCVLFFSISSQSTLTAPLESWSRVWTGPLQSAGSFPGEVPSDVVDQVLQIPIASLTKCSVPESMQGGTHGLVTLSLFKSRDEPWMHIGR